MIQKWAYKSHPCGMPMLAQSRDRGTAPAASALKQSGRSAQCFDHFVSGKDLVPLVQQAGGPQSWWTGTENLVPISIRPPSLSHS